MKVYTIKLYFYGGEEIVPFDYSSMLISFLHNRILGEENKYHDQKSLYSTSPLFNSKYVEGKGFLFQKGAIWLIRTPSLEVFKDFYLNAKNAITKELGYGLILKSVDFNTTEFIDETELVIGASPIYLGQNENSETPDHITYKHGKEITIPKLKQTFLTKSKAMGYNFNENDFNIEFSTNHPIKTKPKLIGTTLNICTLGKIKITGNADVIGLCYGFGIGVSTGCGFGFIYNI